MENRDAAERMKNYILVADGDVDSRFQTSMVLQRFGYNICTASTAEEAIEFLYVASPVAIIAEASAGSGLASRIRKDARFSAVPVILLSAKPSAELDLRARRGEFSAVLAKPVDVEKLYQAIQTAVEKTPRRNIRIDTRLQAQLEGVYAGDGGRGVVAVLSEYGLFFETEEDTPPVHEKRALKFTISQRTIRVEAVVLYAVAPETSPFHRPGMGMKFVTISPDDQAFIRSYILDQVRIGTTRGETGGGGERSR